MIGPIDTMMRWWRVEESVPVVGGEPQVAAAPTTEPVNPEPWLASLDRAHIPRHLNYPCTTLNRLLDQTADRFGPSLALWFCGQTWTYRQLLTAVNRAARGLAALGVRSGDRVLIALPNCPEFVMSFLAVQKIGGVVVNAGPLMGLDDLRAAIQMTTPRVVIGLDLQSTVLTRSDEESFVKHWIWVSLQSYQPILRRLGYQYKLWSAGGRNGHDGSHLSFDQMLEGARSKPPAASPDPSQTAVLQPTGGTTGSLKFARLTHRNLICNAAQVSTWMNGQPGQERILAVLPMFHVYGLTLNLVTAIYVAASIIMTLRFECEEVLDLIRRHQPTVFPLVPAICDAISNRLETADSHPAAPLRGLRLCISGSAPLPSAVAQRFERLTGSSVIEGYGLTEAGPVTHANIPAHTRAGSIGLPMPDTRIRVIDIDRPNDTVGAETPGELLVSGPQVMRGYFANPDQTAQALKTDPDGTIWLHTGDIVRYDADGYFYVLDRKKDMIIRSGLKVYPAKVERVLRQDSRVADVAVIGRDDLVHTHAVVAVVVLVDPPAFPPDGEQRKQLCDELKALCREHLAPYEVPGAFEFIDALPRTALGKLLRRKLLENRPAEPAKEDGSARKETT
jgi:long-chain acyl-CoA synthetase